MAYYPITIQQLDAEAETWDDVISTHALRVNRAGGGERFAAGAGQFHPKLKFECRWSQALEAVAYSPQDHRILYGGRAYNIVDYDDFMQQHRMVALIGEAYG